MVKISRCYFSSILLTVMAQRNPWCLMKAGGLPPAPFVIQKFIMGKPLMPSKEKQGWAMPGYDDKNWSGCENC